MKDKLINRSITFISPFAYPLISQDNSISTGGAERQFYLFGRVLAQLGWRVSFITAKPDDCIDAAQHTFSVYHASFSYLGGSKWKMLSCWDSLIRAMKRADSAFYVVKTPAHLLLPMSFFCHFYRRKLVFWAQTGHDSSRIRKGINRIGSRMQDWGLKKTDIVITQTEDQRRGFMDNYGISAKVVPSICDDLTPTLSTDISSHANGKEIDLLWVGNSLPNKRQEVFFELAKLLPHRKFAIAMNNSDPIRFKQAREDSKKLSNVIFLGTVPPVEMVTWFQKTKLFINTSIREGFPNTFLQAWMNRVPVVSLNIDPDNIIFSKHLGYIVANNNLLVSNDNFEELARKMEDQVEKLLIEDNLRQDMGKRAQEYVNKFHAPNIVVPKLLNTLQQ